MRAGRSPPSRSRSRPASTRPWSGRFHRAVARATARACADAAGARGLDTVVLSGGVWQNRLLLELTTPLLEESGLRVLVPERLPPNDGAISFGQAAVAAAQS